jgi:hypothetical protein
MNDVSCSAVMATRCKLEKKNDGLVLTTCGRHRNKYTPFRNSTVRRVTGDFHIIQLPSFKLRLAPILSSISTVGLLLLTGWWGDSGAERRTHANTIALRRGWLRVRNGRWGWGKGWASAALPCGQGRRSRISEHWMSWGRERRV